MSLFMMPRRRISAASGSSSRSQGQSLVEFAIVVPVFMLFIGGIVQFGFIFWGQNTINQIVRDGGRFAATVENCDGTDNGIIVTATENLAVGTFLADTIAVDAPVFSSPNCPNSNNQTVWVTVSASGTVPILFPWIPGNGTVASSAQYRVEPVLQP